MKTLEEGMNAFVYALRDAEHHEQVRAKFEEVEQRNQSIMNEIRDNEKVRIFVEALRDDLDGKLFMISKQTAVSANEKDKSKREAILSTLLKAFADGMIVQRERQDEE